MAAIVLASCAQPFPGSLAEDQEPNDRFGDSVTLSADGTRVLVGAPEHSDGGAAYVFLRTDDTTAVQEAALTPSAAASDDFFGRSVALTADGSRALIGASRALGGAGAASVFLRTGTTWLREADITDPLATGLGSSVALSADGSRALVGGPVPDPSAADVYCRTDTSWSQETALTVSDGNILGTSVALSADGTHAVVNGRRRGDGSIGTAFTFSVAPR